MLGRRTWIEKLCVRLLVVLTTLDMLFANTWVEDFWMLQGEIPQLGISQCQHDFDFPIRSNLLLTRETLGNWMDGRISCRHSSPTSFLVYCFCYCSVVCCCCTDSTEGGVQRSTRRFHEVCERRQQTLLPNWSGFTYNCTFGAFLKISTDNI